MNVGMMNAGGTAGDFFLRMKKRSAKITAHYYVLEKQATSASDRVQRSFHWTLGVAVGVYVLFPELLILVLCMVPWFAFTIYSSLSRLRELDRSTAVRDGLMMEDEFRREVQMFRDDYTGGDAAVLDELETFEFFLPRFSRLTRGSYGMIWFGAFNAVIMLAFAAGILYLRLSIDY